MSVLRRKLYSACIVRTLNTICVKTYLFPTRESCESFISRCEEGTALGEYHVWRIVEGRQIEGCPVGCTYENTDPELT